MNNLNFDKFQDYFEYNLKKNTHNSDGSRNLTLNEFAKKLGYKSPSLLSMIAGGKRLPSNAILEVLFDEWKVGEVEREIIKLKVEIERRKKLGKSVDTLVGSLIKLDKKNRYHKIDLDTFNSISEWYYLVIQQLVDTPDFDEDYQEISRKLRKKISPVQVKTAIDTLLRLGLVYRNLENGKLFVPKTEVGRESSSEIPSLAIREHHKGMIHRGLDSIEEQAIQDRQFASLTLKFDSRRTSEAKESIVNFIKEFNSQFYCDHGVEVAQLNVQFFYHTDKNDTKSENIQ